jgi:hypothetical protein
MSIFISYRRNHGDDHVAGRIYEWLVRSFGRDRVFKDVDSIMPGTDFRRSLHEAVARCDVLLALIGERWLDATNEFGDRRLDEETDYLRIEIEAALHRDIPVIPLLIDRTAPPRPKDLPESLRDLSYRQAVRVRHDPDFSWDMERIIRALEQILAPKAPAVTSSPSPRPTQHQPPPRIPPPASEPEQVVPPTHTRAQAPVSHTDAPQTRPTDSATGATPHATGIQLTPPSQAVSTVRSPGDTGAEHVLTSHRDAPALPAEVSRLVEASKPAPKQEVDGLAASSPTPTWVAICFLVASGWALGWGYPLSFT